MVAPLVVVHLHRQHQGQIHPSAWHCRHHCLANTDELVCSWDSADLEFWRLAGVSLQACYLPAQKGTIIGSLVLHVINWKCYWLSFQVSVPFRESSACETHPFLHVHVAPPPTPAVEQ